jgi:hypothetical protein
VLRFFKLIDLHVPADLEVHVGLDNLSAHKAPEIDKWLAHPKRARWHLQLHPHEFVVAQPHRALVRGAHQPPAAPRNVRQRR